MIVTFKSSLICYFLCLGVGLLPLWEVHAEEGDHVQAEEEEEEGEEVFEYNVGVANSFMGEDFNVGGFIFPELFVIGTGGVFDSGSSASDYATAEHDPQNDVTVQAIELHFGINLNDVVTGFVGGVGYMGAGEVWETELEEAFLHLHVNENIAIGGGQFLNTFGFQADRHLHGWNFVNQNLVNSRMLNEGELITQGGEVVFRMPDHGVLTIAAGGPRAHSHGAGHGGHGHAGEDEEEHHEDEEDDEHHEEEEDDHGGPGHAHIEADEGNFEGSVFSADYKFRLPVNDSIEFSASVATGENGFGRETTVYGFGFEKVWNGHDHGDAGPEFCDGALMLRSEFMGRNVKGIDENSIGAKFNDYGVSTVLLYGLNERSTLSLRHGWTSSVEAADLADRHRISPGFSTFLGQDQRIQARVQYDYTQSNSIPGEHAAWLQVQIQWGGTGGSHAGHNH